jgi:hypothetical protein
MLTRFVLALAVLGLLSWGLVDRLDRGADTSAGLPALEPPPYDPYLPSWEDELSSPEIQAVWQERRLRLAELSRRFRAESDSARAAALRREMEQVIARTERDILALRLARARRAGRATQAARLAEALARLGPPESVIER